MTRVLYVLGLLSGCLLAIFSATHLTAQLMVLPGSQLASSKVIYGANDGAFPRRIIDPMGRQVALPRPPAAIFSGILAGDEMLSGLVEPSRIRSITYLADDSGISNVAQHYVESLRRNRGTVEEALAVEPDLVIVAAYSNATSVEMLLNTGIPILRFAHFDTYDDIRSNLRTLARALGTEIQAEQWLLQMDSRIARVQTVVADLPRPRVLYYNPSGSTSGPGSLMDETIQLAGGDNVIAELGLRGHTRIAPETAIALQPEVILISDWSMHDGASAKQVLLDNPAWQQVPAIRNQRVYSLRGAWLTSGSPYRVQGIEAVARVLHPQVFESSSDDSVNGQEWFQ